MQHIDQQYAEYERLTKQEWNKPPQDLLDKIIKKNFLQPLDFVYVYDDEKVVGGLTLIQHSKKPKIFELSMVIVNPDYQGKGYGKKLIEKVHEEKGLFIVKSKDKARGFYKRMGYTELKSTPNYFVYMNDEDIGSLR